MNNESDCNEFSVDVAALTRSASRIDWTEVTLRKSLKNGYRHFEGITEEEIEDTFKPRAPNRLKMDSLAFATRDPQKTQSIVFRQSQTPRLQCTINRERSVEKGRGHVPTHHAQNRKKNRSNLQSWMVCLTFRRRRKQSDRDGLVWIKIGSDKIIGTSVHTGIQLPHVD